MQYSLTYLAVAALTYLGLENAQEVVDAVLVVVVASLGLYGRYRAGGINLFGVKK